MRAALFVGVDPGSHGALVALDQRGSVADFATWESVETMAEALWNRIGPKAQGRWLPRVVLEHTHAHPHWSARSCFSFGQWTGAVRAVTCVAGVPLEIVTVYLWQKTMFAGSDGKTPKAKARNVAKRLWPNWEVEHDGLIDAALIAEWLRRRETGK